MKMYDSYERKIMQVAKVKNFVVKFKALFITLVALFVVLLTGFWSTKGLVTDKPSLPTEIVYGQQYSPTESSALFSSTYYEYSVEGSDEWTTEQPTLPGKYVLRTVTEKSFNRTGYSNYINFEIKPKPVEINIIDPTVEYGKYPTKFVYDLLDGHDIDVSLFTFTFEDYSKEATYVSVNADSVVVTNENNEDITSCYEIIPIRQMIRFVDKNIEVKAIDLEKEYDGKPIEFANEIEKYCIDSLIEGDEMTIETIIKNENGEVLSSNPTDVGVYTVEISKTIIYKDKVETTINYGITPLTSTLTITPRELEITTPDKTIVYNGETLQWHEGAVADRLVEGHELVFDVDRAKEFNSITNAGSITNNVEYLIVDEDGTNVTANYSIEYQYGVMTIEQKEIEISPISQTKVYDGNPYEYPSDQFVADLVGDDTITANVKYVTFDEMEISNPIDAAEYFILIDSDSIQFTSGSINNYHIKNFDDVDFAFPGVEGAYRDYLISINCPTLKISKKDVQLSFDVIDGKNSFTFGDEITFNYFVDGLCNDDQVSISVKFEDSDGNIYDKNNIHSGEYVATLDKENTYISVGNPENYNLLFLDNGIDISVTIKTIMVSIYNENDVNELSKEYDGESYIYPTDRYFSDLVYDNKLEVFVYYTDATTGEKVDNPINVGTYNVHIDQENSGLVEGQVSDYYIQYDERFITLNITPKEVEIYIDNMEYQYGDFVNTGFANYSSDDFIGEDYIKAAVYFTDENDQVVSTFNAGTYNIHLDIENTTFSSEEASKNYTIIQKELSTLTIIRRDVIVSLQDVEHVYNGQPYVYDFTMHETKLVGEDKIQVYVSYSQNLETVVPINVGEYVIHLDSVIFEVGLEENYNFIEDNTSSKLNIIPLDVVVSAMDYSEEYDGNVPSYPSERYITLPNIFDIDGSIINVGVNYNIESPVDAGTYEIYIDTNNISFVNGNKENYNLISSSDPAYLTIDPRSILVAPFEVEDVVYNGEPYYYPSDKYYTIDENGDDKPLIGNDTLSVDVYYYDEFMNNVTNPINAGLYYIKIKEAYVNNGNADNYYIEIIGNAIDFEITPLDVTISPIDCEKEYDGYDYIYNVGEYLTSPSLIGEDKVNISVYYTLSNNPYYPIYNPVNANTYQIRIEQVTFIVGLESNYRFTYDTATLVITPKTIIVESIDQYDVYSGNVFYYYGKDYIVDPAMVGSDSLYVSVIYKDENGNVINPIDAGTYNIYIDIANTYLNSGLSSNYNLIASDNPSSLLISPLTITVGAVDCEKEYDGLSYEYNRVDYVATPSLIGEDYLFVSVYYNVEDPINAGLYDVYVDIENTEFAYGNKDNYTLFASVVPATLTITPRRLYVVADSLYNHVYDGTAYNFKENNIITLEDDNIYSQSKSLIGDDEISASFRYTDYDGNPVDKMINAGMYYVYVDNVYVSKGLASNYTLYIINIGIEFFIDTREIYVTPNEMNSIIFGETYEYEMSVNNFVDPSSVNLVEGEELMISIRYLDEFDMLTTPYDAGVYQIIIDEYNSRIFKNGEFIPTSNYTIIQKDPVYFEITKREVFVNTIDMPSITYTGLNQVYSSYDSYGNNYELAKDSLNLAYSDNLYIEVLFKVDDYETYQVKEAGTYEVIISDFNMTSGNLDNYIFTQKEIKTFTIIPRDIVIRPIDLGVVEYSDLDLEYPVDRFEILPLYEDYFIEPIAQVAVKFIDVSTGIEYLNKISDAGTYRVEIVSDTINRNNFNVTYESTMFTLLQSRVDVNIANKVLNKTYDGIYFDDSVFTYSLYGEDYIKINVIYIDESGNILDGKPIDAGLYTILVDSSNPFELFAEKPSNYYVDLEDLLSQEALLNIDPIYLYITIFGDVKTYDATPLTSNSYSLQYGQLVNGHTIKIDDSIEMPTITNVGSIENDLEFVVLDSNSNDITRNYRFIKTIGTLTVTPRELIINTSSESKIYDGNELFNVEYTTNDNLVSSHRLDVLYYSSITNYGSVTNYIEFDIVDENGESVINNYSVICFYGTLTIEKRTVYLTLLETIDSVYDGNYHYYDYSNILGNFGYDLQSIDNLDFQLVENEELMLTVEYYKDGMRVDDPINVGKYDIVVNLSQSQMYKNGMIDYSLLENYNFIISDNKNNEFEITKKRIEISLAGDVVHTYDSYDHSYDELAYVTSDEFVGSDTLWIYVYYKDLQGNEVSPVNVGEYKVYIDGHFMPFGDEDNYEIIYSNEPINLSIVKRQVIVNPNSNYHVFNKEYYNAENLDVYSLFAEDYFSDGFAYNDLECVKFNFIFFDENGNECIPYNVGTYRIEFDTNNIEVLNEDIYRNYEIVGFEPGTLTITPYSIYVSPLMENNQKEYDGNYYYYPTGNGNYVLESSLLEGDELEIKVKFTGQLYSNLIIDGKKTTDSNYYKNGDMVIDYNKAIEASEYSLSIEDFYINGLKSNNYNVYFDSSYYYTINPREVTVTNGDLVAEYTGMPIGAPDNLSLSNIIDEDDRLFISSLNATVTRNMWAEPYEETNAGEYDNKQLISISLDGNVGITHNFLINLEYGKIIINKKKLYVTPIIDNPTRVYDGTTFKINDYNVEGLIEGHKISSVSWTSIKDAGIYSDYEFRNYKISDSNGKSVNKNYEIVYNLTTITIIPKDIYISIEQNIVKEYQGTYFEIDDSYFEYLTDDRPRNLKIKSWVVIDSYGNVVNKEDLLYAGTYTIAVYASDILLDDKANNTNYNLHCDSILYTTFEIKPFDLYEHGYHFYTDGGTAVYSGEPFYRTGIYSENNYYDIFINTELTYDSSYIPYAINPGDEVINDLRAVIIDEYGNDVSYSFILDNPKLYTYGTLRIDDEAEIYIYNMEYNSKDPLYENYFGNSYYGSNLEFYYSVVGRLNKDDPYNYDYSEIGHYDYYIKIDKILVNNKLVSSEAANLLKINNELVYDNGDVYSNIYLIEFTIYPRKIIVGPNSYYEDYHGQEVVLPSYEYTILNENEPGSILLENHKLEITTSGRLGIIDGKMVSSVSSNVITSVIIYDKYTYQDVSYRYDITYTYDDYIDKFGKNSIYGLKSGKFKAKLRYNTRNIEVTTYGNIDSPYEYDGNTFYINEYSEVSFENNSYGFEYDMYGLLPGHHLELKENSYKVGNKVGDFVNKLDFNIYDENGIDVSSCYNVEYTDTYENRVFITGRKITVTSGSISKKFSIYDGPLTFNSYSFTSDKLLEGHTIEVIITGSINHIGTVKNTIESVNIYQANGNNVNKFYDIEIIEGTLTLY